MIINPKHSKSRLTFLKETRTGKGYEKWALYLCSCGNTKEIRMRCIKRKNPTLSCGCYRKELCPFNDIGKSGGSPSHGMAKSRPYRIWANIKQRINNQRSVTFKNYGKRGLKVCDKWKTFEGFWDDMKDTYSNNLTIDRIDTNGDYCKENCRWATLKEQANNKRNNAKYTFNGETHSISEWSEKACINQSTLWMRLKTYGWDIKKSLTYKTKLCLLS